MPAFHPERDGRPIKTLLSAEQIAARAAELGRTITDAYRPVGAHHVLVGVL